MPLQRVPPTPRAQRIFTEITSLTALDCVWLARELKRMLDHPDDEPDAGVREPRRPDQPFLTGAAELGVPLEQDAW